MKENKLIAEFMGLPLVPCNIGTENGVVAEGYKHPKVDVPLTLNGLQYHTSWDWLMPVVNKCYQEHMSKHIEKVVMTFDIEKVHKAVVEFINEYNKNK